MIKNEIFSKEVDLSVEEAANYIRNNAQDYGFIVRYDSDMAKEFESHGVNVEEGFEYITLMLCIPKKAYDSLLMNPKRAALIMPKQVSIFRDTNLNKTIVSHLVIGEYFLENVLPNDKKIKESLPQSCKKVVELIKSIDNLNGE